MRNWLSLGLPNCPWASTRCLPMAEFLCSTMRYLHRTDHIKTNKPRICWFTIGGFISFGLRSCSNFLLMKIGSTIVPILWLRSFICLLTALADIWSLKGRLIRTTELSFTRFTTAPKEISRTKLFMVEFMRATGYWSQIKMPRNLLHSSLKASVVQDKECARWIIVFSKHSL